MIDDNRIYSILEDIRKYFSIHVITVISYRSSQLFNAVLQGKMELNETLLNYRKFIEINENELINQSSKYIEKLIPSTQRIFLHNNKDLLNSNFKDLVSTLISSEDEFYNYFIQPYDLMDSSITISEWLYKTISRTTKLTIEPIDKKEENEYILPNNIRGVLQLVEIIMRKFKFEDESTLSNYRDNVKEYKNYLYSASIDKLKIEDKQLLEEWEFIDYSSKNYFMYSNLLTRIFDFISEDKSKVYSDQNYKYLLRINEMENMNISVGDVYMIIEEYKKIVKNDISNLYFIYMIKMLYSIELLTNYLEYAICNEIKDSLHEEQHLKKYLTLINVKVMPDNFIYYGTAPDLFFKFDKNLDERFLGKITYTSSTIAGYVTQRTRPTFSETWKLTETLPLKYRQYFNFKNIELTNKRKYSFDPFAFLGKEKYVVKSLNQSNYYIFTSLFDIDIFIRINYARRSESNPLGRVLKKINRVFEYNSDNKEYEDILSSKLVGFLKIEKSKKRCLPFLPQELEYELDKEGNFIQKVEKIYHESTEINNEFENFLNINALNIKSKDKYITAARGTIEFIKTNYPNEIFKNIKNVEESISYLEQVGKSNERITLKANHREYLNDLHMEVALLRKDSKN